MVRKYTATRFRKNGYRKKTLRKGNIFKNKSAKGQAKQIYALNKKINRLAYKTRPETIIKQTPMFKIRNDISGNIDGQWNRNDYLYETYLLGENYCDYTMKGSMIKNYDFTLYGDFKNLEYTYVNSAGESYNLPLTGYLRIIVCRLAGGNQGRYPSQITRDFDPTSGQPDFGRINGPLIDNLKSSGLIVVKDKVIKIDENHPCKMWRIKIRNNNSLRYGPSSTGSPAGKNEYLIYYQYYCPVLLREDPGTGAIVTKGPLQVVNAAVKFAFTDEGKE